LRNRIGKAPFKESKKSPIGGEKTHCKTAKTKAHESYKGKKKM